MATFDQIPQDITDSELVRILESMLNADETISARAVARRHSSIKHASTITRHNGRSGLVAHYRARQREFRVWLNRLPKRSTAKIALQMAEKDVKIAELERQVEALRISHLALIRAVGELGGVSKWLKFFENFAEVKETLQELRAMPASEIRELQTMRTNKHPK
jgi:hypothetical protein